MADSIVEALRRNINIETRVEMQFNRKHIQYAYH